MRWTIAIGAVVVGLAACRSTPPTIKLELADASLAITAKAGATHTLAMSPAGVMSFDGAPFVTLTGTGRLLVDGKPTGNVDPDGSIRQGKELTNAKVTKDGAFVLSGGDELAIAADGTVSGSLLDTIDHPRLGTDLSMRYTGPAGARRAMMIGLVLFVTAPPAPAAPN